MKYYLLAMHHAGDPPSPEVLEPIMRDLAVVKEDNEGGGRVGLRRGTARP